MMLFFSCTSLFLLLPSIALSLNIIENVITLHNASDFIELADTLKRNVTRLKGSTIVLDSDIDFTDYSDQFEPIGRNYTLAAKFDGQGHTISNLHVNSSSRFTAIFGMTNGTSFKNLVVDSSCSIHSTHMYMDTAYISYVGSIIGYVYSDRKDANSIIENLVNMASVSSSGRIDPMNILDFPYTLAIGGVIGYFVPKRTDTTIRNCVNYGQVTQEGSVATSSLGGILGAFLDIENTGNSSYITIKNCANYGNLVHAGKTTRMLGFGGITAIALDGIVERCMNFGSIITNMETIAGGQIVGGGNERLTIKDCIWTQNKNTDVAYGYSYGQEVVVENSRLVTFNAKNLMDLNDWAEANSEKGLVQYNKWMALHLDGGSVGNASGVFLPAMIGCPIIDPTKEGHTFLHWCLNSNCTDGPATKEDVLKETTTELYAIWNVNSYTATFIMNNGTFLNKTFMYNETIAPPDMTRVKKFHGWNLTYERMPAFNIIIVPNNPPEKTKAAMNPGAIAGGVVGGVAGVAIVVLIVLFVVLQKARKKEKEIKMAKMNKVNKSMNISVSSRVVDAIERKGDSNTIILSSEVVENPSEYLDLYSGYFKTPSISEALIQAGLDRDKAERAERYCMNTAKRAESEGALSSAFTLDDAAAVALYTYDFGSGYLEINPYVLLNKALASGDSADVQRVRGLLYLIMCALRKLPRCSGKTLYRGLKMSIDKDAYVNGRVIAWRRLTSTSTDMKTVKSFLDSSMEHDKSTGTLFVIDDGWGYNLQPYSLFPDEEEILLEPNRQFVVESVIESDVTIVNLRMLDTPLVLPEVFGGGSK